jgi:thioredoxin reductase (NADPH)
MLIIGGGPGGYTAALYAARACLSAVVLEKLSAGGQMAQSHRIDNYPGCPEGIDGCDLAERMQQQAERFGAVTEYAEVRELDLKSDPKVLKTPDGDFYGRTVVIATGAGPRKLGLPNEERLTGRGVHYCAHCDGMFYRGKTVVLVGGGNSAAAEALHLSRLAEKVILVHRRDTLRATKLYHEPLMKLPNIEFKWNSAVVELPGENRLSGVKIRNLISGEEELLDAAALFVSIGRTPSTALVQGQLELENGYIVADESARTSIPGVFAVGDVRTKALRQIITAAADGANAAHFAEEYLEHAPA